MQLVLVYMLSRRSSWLYVQACSPCFILAPKFIRRLKTGVQCYPAPRNPKHCRKVSGTYVATQATNRSSVSSSAKAPKQSRDVTVTERQVPWHILPSSATTFRNANATSRRRSRRARGGVRLGLILGGRGIEAEGKILGRGAPSVRRRRGPFLQSLTKHDRPGTASVLRHGSSPDEFKHRSASIRGSSKPSRTCAERCGPGATVNVNPAVECAQRSRASAQNINQPRDCALQTPR